MKNGLFVCVVVLLALASGCNPEATKPAKTNEAAPVKVSTLRPYEVKYEEMAAKLKIGMEKDDVRKALGDPTETRGIYGGGKNYGLWLYEVDKGIVMRIRFDDDDKVATWSMVAENVVY